MQDMPTIAELERRITAAFDRIGQGLANRPAGDMPALQDALESERSTAAQLAERLRSVKQRETAATADFEARIAELTAARDQQALEQDRLHKTVAELRDTLTTQTEAMRAGVTAPEAIHQSLLAEMQALRAERRDEAAEMQAILSALEPLLEEVTPDA